MSLTYRGVSFRVCALVLGLALGLGGVSVHAEKADKAMPMTAQADAMRHDDQKQVTDLTGNVVVTKGSIVMRGGRIEIRQDVQGNHSATIYTEMDTPAFFRQKREGLNEFIEGQADRIEYDSAANTVTLYRKAVFRRLGGTAVLDELKGSKIVYDSATDRYAVDGGPANASVINPSGRVTATIAAKPKNVLAPAATSAAASGAAPTLRTISRIGEKTN